MPAYMIVRVNISDMDQYRQYMRLTPPIVEKFGGQFILRGADKHILEGPDVPERVVIVKYPDVESAIAFYNSPEYQAAIKVREGAAEASFIVMEGLE